MLSDSETIAVELEDALPVPFAKWVTPMANAVDKRVATQSS